MTDGIKEKVIELHRKGYSVRDTERALLMDGIQCSFSSVSRIIRDSKKSAPLPETERK